MGALSGVAVGAGLLVIFPAAIMVGPPQVRLSPAVFAEGFGKYLLALFVNPFVRDFNPGFWGVYPPGTSFLSPIETLMVAFGSAAMFRSSRPRWGWILVLVWICLGIMPAAVTDDGLRYSRAIGVLVPLTLLAAAGAGYLKSTLPRFAPWVLAVWLVVMGLGSWRGYFDGYCRDPRVATWSNIVDVELAQYLAGRAQESRLVILNNADSSSVLEFLLHRELQDGRIVFRPGASPTGVFETVFREPVSGQPMMFVFRVPEREAPGETALLLVNPDGFLGRATAAESAGRWKDAARAYREALAMFPEFGVARWRLAGVLEKLGRKGESAEERAWAVRLGVGGPGARTGN